MSLISTPTPPTWRLSMQMGGRMRPATGQAPVVLPEVRAQAAVQRPLNSLGVAVYAGRLVADDGFPASQVGRDLRLAVCSCHPRLACCTPAYFSASRCDMCATCHRVSR